MVEYRLIRSDRRTLGLEVTPEFEVVVRAPRRLPQSEIHRFVEQHTGWIRRKLEEQQRRCEAAQAWQVTPEQERELRRQAAEWLPRRVAHFAPLMQVTPTGVKITSAQKRWGSCSGKNSLCFSWRLMLLSPEAIDYVVVHELAHIRHHNHSREFWAFVREILPDYQVRQRLLSPRPARD